MHINKLFSYMFQLKMNTFHKFSHGSCAE